MEVWWKMKIAINRRVIDKTGNNETLNNSFQNEDISQVNLAHEINQGHAFTSQHNGRKKSENFTCSQMVALDYDDAGIEGLETIMKDPLVKDYHGIWYHTPSSTPEEPHFRLIFELEQPIYDGGVYKDTVMAFMSRLDYGVDKACKDICRAYFGSKGSEPEFTEKVIPSGVVNEIVTNWRNLQEAENKRKQAERASRGAKAEKVPAGETSSSGRGVSQEQLDNAGETANGFLRRCRELNWTGYGKWQATASWALSLDHAFGTSEFYNRFCEASRNHPEYKPADEKKLNRDFQGLGFPNQDFAFLGLNFDFDKNRAFDPSLPGFKPTIKGTTAREPLTRLDYDAGNDGQPAGPEADKPQKHLWHISELLGDIKPTTWLFKPYLQQDSTAFIVGDGGVGKSFFALDLALTIAKEKTVVYVAAEGQEKLRKRLLAWVKYHKCELPGGFHVWDRPVFPADGNSRAGFLKELGEAQVNPDLIVLDTLARCALGLDENSQKDMGLFVEGVDRLKRETSACIFTIHHTNRGGSERGSTSIRNSADTFIKLVKEGDVIKVVSDKEKDEAEFEKTYFSLKQIELPEIKTEDGEGPVTSAVAIPADPNSFIIDSGKMVTGNVKTVLEALALETFTGSGATWKRLMDSLGWENASRKAELFRILSKLLRAGFLYCNTRFWVMQ